MMKLEDIRDRLLNPENVLSKEDAIKGINQLVQLVGGGWHPDDDMREVIDIHTQKPSFSTAAAEYIMQFTELCEKQFDQEEEFYEECLKAHAKLRQPTYRI